MSLAYEASGTSTSDKLLVLCLRSPSGCLCLKVQFGFWSLPDIYSTVVPTNIHIWYLSKPPKLFSSRHTIFHIERNCFDAKYAIQDTNAPSSEIPKKHPQNQLHQMLNYTIMLQRNICRKFTQFVVFPGLNFLVMPTLISRPGHDQTKSKKVCLHPGVLWLLVLNCSQLNF